MTPREALAQALHGYFRDPSTKPLDLDGLLLESADALLAALPEGWVLADFDDLTEAVAEAARAQERERLLAAVRAIEPGCHSHSGLMCEEDEYGWCYLIVRQDVLALLEDPGL
jgi:hypothetical protein